MKRVGHLYERVAAWDNLLAAAYRAMRGKKRSPAVQAFWFHLEPELERLHHELAGETYRSRPYRSFTLYEPKPRQICAAPFRDRVVHHALCRVLEPYFERRLIHDTYACRIGKGTHAAVRRARQFARCYPYVLQCDVRKYFDSVHHTTLKALLARLFKDRRLLRLLGMLIDHPVPGRPPGRGLPIGNLTSQHFANLYLGELDHFVKERLRVRGYVRYMDDLLLFGTDQAELWAHHAVVRAFAADRLKLTLKAKATRIAPVASGIPFLGFVIRPGGVRLQGAKWRRFRRQVRRLESVYAAGMLCESELAQHVGSMLGHTAHADSHAARQRFFESSLALV